MVPPDGHNDVKTPGVKIWRTINAIMTVFFLLAAYVNINDGDWYIWVPVYTVPGILSLISCIKPDSPNTALWSYSALAFLGICIALGVYIIISAVELKGVNNPLKVEEGRELSGVLIMLTWIGMSRFTNIGRPGGSVNNNVLRNSLLLIVCLLAIIPVTIWSLCFHESGSGFGHCKGMFQDNHRKQEF